MKKILQYILPITAIIVFILVMLSGNFLKKPHNPSEDVIGYVTVLLDDVNTNNWTNAEDNVTKLESAWEKISRRIQFSVELIDIFDINNNIARLKGAVFAKDKANSLMELYQIQENWNLLTR
ncbi:DUF4363 family protein [Clostridium ganghwense]|uniref:DUF4363 family protein n=1 Tax=Clostridium ganghwense TaxID=312089 RepID=A0ABT4CLU9_9CLOT|nr:DUF4363 family protein [Clostridium ganghwense]MCY6370013.1 DUF4363 family protein [Clostridium ganghwense]